jgi:ubiquinone/menaquinone biosynthesis C-methylase UbiE
MDLVLDRAALTHNTRAAITATIGEIRRVLKPGGHFVSVTFFSTAHHLAHTGQEVEPNTRVDVTGALAGTGIVHFTSQSELEEMLSGFELRHLEHHVIDVSTPASAGRRASYSAVARKPLDAGA